MIKVPKDSPQSPNLAIFFGLLFEKAIMNGRSFYSFYLWYFCKNDTFTSRMGPWIGMLFFHTSNIWNKK